MSGLSESEKREMEHLLEMVGDSRLTELVKKSQTLTSGILRVDHLNDFAFWLEIDLQTLEAKGRAAQPGKFMVRHVACNEEE